MDEEQDSNSRLKNIIECNFIVHKTLVMSDGDKCLIQYTFSGIVFYILKASIERTSPHTGFHCHLKMML